VTRSLTIGLPVFNGETRVARCLDSLLAQTYPDFDLVIHDNESTDRTAEICREYARRDTRVKYRRHAPQLQQSMNFRTAVMEAETPFFMWAADDDIWGPDFAKACIAELEEHPNAVCCTSRVTMRYPDGTSSPSRGTFAICGSPLERVRTYLLNPRDSSRLYGVHRTAALKASYPDGLTLFGWDWVVSCLTFLHGDHLQADVVALERAGHGPGKYFEKYDRHFVRPPGVLGRLSWLFPLMPLTVELKRRLPPDIWRASRWRLVRLNLLQTLLLLTWKYPVLQGSFNLIRAADRAVTSSTARN
jgi:glycosyltransferase involved in cell wall biosynthesis